MTLLHLTEVAITASAFGFCLGNYVTGRHLGVSPKFVLLTGAMLVAQLWVQASMVGQ